MTRVLVTGAGGPAGIAVIRSLAARGDVEVYAADMDGWASGLYLVPGGRRRLVPAGLAPGFLDAVTALVTADRIDVVVPTVDVEMPVLAAHRGDLGAALAAPAAATLAVALDKYALARACEGLVQVPRTALLDEVGAASPWSFPVIVKPRRGAGSRGVLEVSDAAALAALAAHDAAETDPPRIVQELLPGAEYSVDVLADAAGRVVAAVPRTRARVDSGVSVAGATFHDAELEKAAAVVAGAIGLVGVANVQFRRDVAGDPALLEVNPRFAGAMPLTRAAGVDLPSLALDLALGRPLPASVPHAELACVRYLEDVFLPPSEVVHP